MINLMLMLVFNQRFKNLLGSHATYVAVSWADVLPVPDTVSTETAAAAFLQGMTVCTFAEEAYKVKPGDTILVHTVAGGVGLLFAQLGKHIGATVIGTTSTPEKAQLAKENGATHVILYNQEDTVKRVLEITNGEGVEAIFDGVGKDTYDCFCCFNAGTVLMGLLALIKTCR